MLKKSSILLNPHHGIYHSSVNASSSSPSPRRPRCQRQHLPPHRTYAVVSNGYSKHNHDADLRWPEVTSANAIPTPYQIFNQRKGSPYSKRRFYELVKLYHPDRHSLENSSPYDLPHAIKLERYRLVVAANDILSDPVRRGAYDRYGAGWNGQPSINTTSNGSPWSESHGRGWGFDPKGPSQNATWEDWEAWRNPKQPQEPQFASNPVFVVLVIVLATVGIMGQVTRADGFSRSFLDQRDAMHIEMSKDLMKRRRDTRNTMGDRQTRVFDFLRQRNEGMTGTEEEYLILMQQTSGEERQGEGMEPSTTKEETTAGWSSKAAGTQDE